MCCRPRTPSLVPPDNIYRTVGIVLTVASPLKSFPHFQGNTFPFARKWKRCRFAENGKRTWRLSAIVRFHTPSHSYTNEKQAGSLDNAWRSRPRSPGRSLWEYATRRGQRPWWKSNKNGLCAFFFLSKHIFFPTFSQSAGCISWAAVGRIIGVCFYLQTGRAESFVSRWPLLVWPFIPLLLQEEKGDASCLATARMDYEHSGMHIAEDRPGLKTTSLSN